MTYAESCLERAKETYDTSCFDRQDMDDLIKDVEELARRLQEACKALRYWTCSAAPADKHNARKIADELEAMPE